MTKEEFIEKFKNREISIRSEESEGFKELCEELQEKATQIALHDLPSYNFKPKNLYDYATFCAKQGYGYLFYDTSFYNASKIPRHGEGITFEELEDANEEFNNEFMKFMTG